MFNPEKCESCGKKVYVTEKVQVDRKYWHRSCFKCNHCSKIIQGRAYTISKEDGLPYCPDHYLLKYPKRHSYVPSSLAAESKKEETPAPAPTVPTTNVNVNKRDSVYTIMRMSMGELPISKPPSVPVTDSSSTTSTSSTTLPDPDRRAKRLSSYGKPMYEEGCFVCGKSMYPFEKMVAKDKVMHRQCFKCSQCGTSLNANRVAIATGKLYCDPHFKAIFAKQTADAPVRENKVIDDFKNLKTSVTGIRTELIQSTSSAENSLKNSMSRSVSNETLQTSAQPEPEKPTQSSVQETKNEPVKQETTQETKHVVTENTQTEQQTKVEVTENTQNTQNEQQTKIEVTENAQQTKVEVTENTQNTQNEQQTKIEVTETQQTKIEATETQQTTTEVTENPQQTDLREEQHASKEDGENQN